MASSTWFRKFYITPAMAAAGMKKADYDVDELDDDLETLSHAAYSMYSEAMDGYTLCCHPEQFDDITLTNINAYLEDSEDDEEDKKEVKGSPTRAQLEKLADEVVQREMEYGDVGIDHHPRYWLLCGILCQENWVHLSDSDVTKMAEAHGVVTQERKAQVEGILKSQIILLQEMYDKGHEQECRSYDNVAAILADNCAAIGKPMTFEEDYDDRKYNKESYKRSTPSMRPPSPLPERLSLPE